MKKICVFLMIILSFQIVCYASSQHTLLTDEDFSFTASQNKENKHTVNFVQEVWPEELESISAEVISENYAGSKNISCILSLYSDSKQLISVSVETVRLSSCDLKTIFLTADGAEKASVAKVHLWNSDTQQPLRQTKELHKLENAATIFLDSSAGSDTNDGSFDSPIKTLDVARRMVRRKKYELTDGQNAIYIILKNGEYFIEKELAIGANDGGSDNHSVVFTALERHKAIVTGAKTVGNFELFETEKNIYRTFVGKGVKSRHLYANGIRCPRAARYEPLAGFQYSNGEMTCTETDFLNYKHVEDIEFSFEVNWMHDRCRLTGITQLDDGRIRFDMNENAWRYIKAKTQYKTTAEPTYLENAYEFIDEEGEWYLDTHEGYLYYKPRFFENMETTRFTLPVAEDFIKVSSLTDPVKNISFRGLHFTESTWLFPETNGGICIIQNEAYRDTNGESVYMDAAIDMRNVDGVQFENCKFSKLGKTALKFSSGVFNSKVIGNEFSDMSAGALSVGGVTDTERNPANTSVAVKNVRVENNFVNGAALDIKSTAAISAGFPIDTTISHNEIYNTGYSGIHTGWGWDSTAPAATENFTISNNYIHHILNCMLYDGGAVYTLGHTNGSYENPNRVTGNYVRDIMKPFGAFYPDQGSSYWRISDNVVDLSKQPYCTYGTKNQNTMESRWTHIHMNTINHIYYGKNYSTTYNHLNRGTSISYKSPEVYANANWPLEAKVIINNSGIMQDYADSFRYGLEEFSEETTSVKKGKRLVLEALPTTSKGKFYHPGKFICYATIADDGILEKCEEGIYAVNMGTTAITLTGIENGILIKHPVTVTVTK